MYVGTAVPGTAYDGQIWVCTSSDPPLLKNYDDTNSNWRQHHETRYDEVTSGQLPVSGAYLDGTLSVVYDTEQSSATLYAYANGSWRDMGGSLSRVYPVGDQTVTSLYSGGTTSLGVGNRIDSSGGYSYIMYSGNITPENSGDYVVAYAAGFSLQPGSATSGTIRMFVGAVQIGELKLLNSVPRDAFSICSGTVASDTSTNVYVDLYFNNSGQIYLGPTGFGAVSVKT